MASLRYLTCGLAVLLCISGWRAEALVTYHAQEALGVTGWSAELTEIVNDKARVSGRVGPFGPIAEFQYDGGAETFQRVLEKFARLPGQTPRLYLHPGSGAPDAQQKTAEQHDFAVSITTTGEGSLHVFIGRIPLQKMKIPANIVVAASPVIDLRTGTQDVAYEEDLRRIEAFIKEREAREKSGE